MDRVPDFESENAGSIPAGGAFPMRIRYSNKPKFFLKEEKLTHKFVDPGLESRGC